MCVCVCVCVRVHSPQPSIKNNRVSAIVSAYESKRCSREGRVDCGLADRTCVCMCVCVCVCVCTQSRSEPLSEDHARFYLASVICAFQYMHDKELVFRDLKVRVLTLCSRSRLHAQCNHGHKDGLTCMNKVKICKDREKIFGMPRVLH